MITLITGAPGAGKTAACVQLLMQFQAEGRPLFVDGIPDLKIVHLSLEDPHKWYEDVPDGSVIVIDEVQRVWRPAGSGTAVPRSIAELEVHRHRGIEFVIMTQHPNLVHSNVRRLVGRHIHLRDLGFLGRHWYEWPECANPESWKGALVKKRYKLPKKTFRMYKSASLHVPPVRSVPRALIVFLICAPLAVFLTHRVYARISSFTADSKETSGIDKLAGKGSEKKTSTVPGQPVPVEPPGRVLPVAARIEAEQLKAEEAAKRIVGCIHQGPRCECIDQAGFWVTVELKLCTSSAARSGLGIPYDVAGATTTTAGKKAVLPAQAAPAATRSAPKLQQTLMSTR